MSFSTPKRPESSSSYSPQSCRRFTLSEIELATHNFDESLVIGRGGFGKVYKGSITYGERLLDAAIKRLESGSNQGSLEFWAEVETLSNLRHCHLVCLIGYCSDGQEMILVYEYMPYGTLADRLHKHRFQASWVRRLKMCIGAARGLDYLHTGTGIKHGVIHRDVKSSNILLDSNWAAKISDFGLSKIGPINQPSTYVNTSVRGTFGYLDPNYFQTGRLTRKSDVYAFGVVLFELLCGKKAVDSTIDEEQPGLATWAQESIKEGKLKQIVDSNLKERISIKCLKEFALLAVRCLHSRPKQRPTMAEVIAGLESILSLQEKPDTTLLNKYFGRTVPALFLQSNPENTAEEITLKSLDRYLYTVGGEDQILHRFNFNTILQATENFSKANMVFYHRYGSRSYKGRLQNGQEMIVTQYSDVGTYQECMDVASLLVKPEHENVIQLLGYCIDGTMVCLLYDFALNATLDRLIYDPSRSNVLDLCKRYKIIVGVARGLAYLHHHAPISIIHGHVKVRHIALDERFDPKLWSFGQAMAVNESDCIYVNNIPGNLGYITPECLQALRVSTKTDVYAFGVLVLETISGKPASSEFFRTQKEMSMLSYIRRKCLEGTLSDVVDPIIYNVDLVLATKLVQIGLLCCRDSYQDRPTMEEVVGMLLGTSTLPALDLEPRVNYMSTDLDGLSEEDYDATDYDATAVGDFMSELCPR